MKDLIEKLRKGIVTSAPYEPMYTVPPAAICLEAADEIERLTELAYHQVQKISGQAIQIEVLTAEIELCRGVRGELADRVNSLTAELAVAKEVMAHDREYIDELLGKLK